MTAPTPDSEASETERFLAECVGTWFVEGDPFEVIRSPEGGLLATGAGGSINPAWVISRGIKGSPTPAPTPSELGDAKDS
jgi:hypothetical protein